MSYQVLYRAWRPTSFDDVCGQDAIVQTLRRQVVTQHIAHAYLFCGTRGTGKTTASKILSRAVNCLHPNNGDPCGECEICRAILSETCMDVQEIDAASNNGVDEIRDLRDKILFPPTLTRYKVYIIDEVHMLSSGAFTALLKTLEEPPEHAVFILATTEPQKLPATILSRCQRFDFHRIGAEAIVGRLRTVLAGIGREAEDDALLEIARAAEGAMRDALSLLDSCLSYTDGVVTLQLTREVLGTAGRAFLFEFTDALLRYDAGRALTLINDMMDRGCDPLVFARDVTAHLRALLLANAVGDVSGMLEVTPEDAARFAEQAKATTADHLMRLTELFMRVESESRWVTRPRTMVELMTVRACHPEEEKDATLTERMERMEKLLENGVTVRAAAPGAEKKSAAANKSKPAAKAPEPIQPGEAPQGYTDGLNLLKQREPQLVPQLNKLIFLRMEDNVIVAAMPDAFTQKLMERKTALMEAALSESFGSPVKLRFEDGKRKAAPPAQSGAISREAKKALEVAERLFDRSEIELTD